eukprot:m.279064 g.279064  ORF g.279064 m.279064 type:complete len:53 (-) comp19796_c0_seq4:394-552(-)
MMQTIWIVPKCLMAPTPPRASSKFQLQSVLHKWQFDLSHVDPIEVSMGYMVE